MELSKAVFDNVRERIELLDAYLGDEETPERCAPDELLTRLRETEDAAGVARGVKRRIDYAPDFGYGERRRVHLRRMPGPQSPPRGRKGGWKPVMGERRIALAFRLLRDSETPISDICSPAGVSKATLYRYLEPNGTRRLRG